MHTLSWLTSGLWWDTIRNKHFGLALFRISLIDNFKFAFYSWRMCNDRSGWSIDLKLLYCSFCIFCYVHKPLGILLFVLLIYNKNTLHRLKHTVFFKLMVKLAPPVVYKIYINFNITLLSYTPLFYIAMHIVYPTIELLLRQLVPTITSPIPTTYCEMAAEDCPGNVMVAQPCGIPSSNHTCFFKYRSNHN